MKAPTLSGSAKNRELTIRVLNRGSRPRPATYVSYDGRPATASFENLSAENCISLYGMSMKKSSAMGETRVYSRL